MLVRSVFALAFGVMSAGSAFALGGVVKSAPEIDGPAGMSAMVLLVCAGLLAYNRLKG